MRRRRLGDAPLQLGRLQGVGLGEHDLIGDRRLVERVEHAAVDGFQAVPGVDQHVDAGEIGASAQVGVDQRCPGGDLFLAGRRVAVARHVDQGQAPAEIEEVEFLGAAGRVRGAGERLAPGERVDEARLADVRAAREGDLDALHGRQVIDAVRRPDEAGLAREQLAAGLQVRLQGRGKRDGLRQGRDQWKDFALPWRRTLGNRKAAPKDGSELAPRVLAGLRFGCGDRI